MDQSTNKTQQLARERATEIVSKAWGNLPDEHKRLLEEVGAAQWSIETAPLGEPIHRLLRSSGSAGLSKTERERLASALAVWVPSLRVVVLNASHPALTGLGDVAYERFLAETAWHEWGHALSIVRCTPEDVADGRRLLDLAPTAVRKHIRSAGYGPREYTHELVAEVYALLVEWRRQGKRGRPEWLNQEIYELVARATGWPG